MAKYKPYARPFLPLRFLNLLPLSHLFGQSMATNIPPLVDGTVVFMRSFNPHDIVRRVKEWRVSVIVCVPKILDVLRDHVIRIDPAAADPPKGLSIPARWWRYRAIHRAFGYKYWAFVVGAAPLGPELEEFWKRLGFVVIQGYGLTETAPIVTLNHPFKTNTGSVGTPVGGVEVKIADGRRDSRPRRKRHRRVLRTGRESGAGSRESDKPWPEAGRLRDADGWLHTGDIGELDGQGRLFIRGRKKEMIVTPEGLNVFPDDVERALDGVAGVEESAVVGQREPGTTNERVHAVLVLDPGVTADAVVAAANTTLADHQRIRSASVWTSGPLPRTEGTRKLKRAAIREWVEAGASAATAPAPDDALQSVLARFTAGRATAGNTTLEALGLSSLERVELMVALEDKFQTRLDETKFAGARTLDELKTAARPRLPPTPSSTSRWTSRAGTGGRFVGLDSPSQPGHLDPAARPPVRLGAGERPGTPRASARTGRVRRQPPEPPGRSGDPVGAARPLAGAGRAGDGQGVLQGTFLSRAASAGQVVTNRLNYYLSAFFFNAFPLPQREAGARQTLRYIGEVTGDGFSVLIFPEGVRSNSGDIKPFRGGIGMIASRLHLPVVPVRLDGVDRVLHPSWKMARPGPCSVTFGAPVRLTGDDYAALATKGRRSGSPFACGARA